MWATYDSVTSFTWNLLRKSVIRCRIVLWKAPFFFLLFFTFLRLSDYKRSSVHDEDDDVAAERQRIYDGGSKTDILQIRDLSKVTPDKYLSGSFSPSLFLKTYTGLYFPFILWSHAKRNLTKERTIKLSHKECTRKKKICEEFALKY